MSATDPEVLLYTATPGAGYRTRYRSPGLTDAEAEEIAARSGPADVRGPDDARAQYYHLRSSGRVVVARAQLLATDGPGEDAWYERLVGHRPETYLVQALVYEQASFLAVGNDPFRAMAAFDRWARTSSAVIRLYLPDEAPSSAPPLPSGGAGSYRSEPAPWRADTFPELYGCAERAGETTRAGKCVFLQAAPASAEGILCHLFQFLSPEARARCTFDTLVRGTVAPAGAFWFTAAIDGPPQRGPDIEVLLDATDQKVPATGGAASLEQRYLARAIARHGYDQAARNLEPVRALIADFRAGRPCAPSDEGTANEFLSVADDELVVPQLRKTLATKTGLENPDALIAYLARQRSTGAITAGAWIAAVRPESRAANEWAADWMTADLPQLTHADADALARFAAAAGSRRLAFLAHVLAPAHESWKDRLLQFRVFRLLYRRRPDAAAEAVREMSAQEYDLVAPLAGGPVPVERFLGGKHTARLFKAAEAWPADRFLAVIEAAALELSVADVAEQLAEPRLKEAGGAGVIDRVVESVASQAVAQGRGKDLGRLADAARRISPAVAARLTKLIAGNPSVDCAFKNAVATRSGAAPEASDPYIIRLE